MFRFACATKLPIYTKNLTVIELFGENFKKLAAIFVFPLL